ncbi:MAG: DUF1707 domain-containing protein [Gemmatimonadaceae bacterium]
MTVPGQPPPSIQVLEHERERVITVLSREFANDNLSIDELETRLELAYRASSVAEIRALAADLADAEHPMAGTAVRPAPPPSQLARTRFVSVLGNRARRGVWVPPQVLDVLAVMSDTHLDLREAQFSAGITEIRVKATMAAVRITVPPYVHVTLDTSSILASVSIRTDRGPPPPHGAPVVRVTGWALMSDVSVRRRSIDD